MSIPLQEIHDLQRNYVESLAKQIFWPKEQLWDLVRWLWPEIIELENEAGYTAYRITMSPFANTIGAIMCSDHNVGFHTNTGVLQTLTLVGMCSAVTSRFKIGYALRKIQPEISFVRTVPIGASVIMLAREIKARGPLSIFELRARIEGSDEELFSEPRILTMFKIPISK